MSWRVALIDSCGEWPGAVEAAAFVDESAGAGAGAQRGARAVKRCATGTDATGHGSRLARLLTDDGAVFELLLGQVFLGTRPASAAAVAAAIDWAVAGWRPIARCLRRRCGAPLLRGALWWRPRPRGAVWFIPRRTQA